MLRSSFLFGVLFPALMMCWAAVFIYNAVASDTGYGALLSLQSEVAAKTAEVDALRARRMALEKKADLLSSRSLDPDMIDERIRTVLGYARDGDIVVSRRELDRLLADKESN